MNALVIDTNVFMSALIKKGLTRELLTNLKMNFLFPEYEFEELQKYKQLIKKKSGYNEKEFYIILLRLLKYVRIIPADVIIDFYKPAFEIIGNIDNKDVVFIATALAFNCGIWSDDKHFKMQNEIKVYTTNDVKSLKWYK